MADELQRLQLLGQAIRLMREERGLNASELAGAAEINEGRLSSLEDGDLDPPYDLLVQVADGLGIRPSEFVVRAEGLGERGVTETSTAERQGQRVIKFKVFRTSVQLTINARLRFYP